LVRCIPALNPPPQLADIDAYTPNGGLQLKQVIPLFLRRGRCRFLHPHPLPSDILILNCPDIDKAPGPQKVLLDPLKAEPFKILKQRLPGFFVDNIFEVSSIAS
jgi:hypothetical protein